MNTPLVSVIIPNYNHAPYLEERIESVINQTYENIEVIILDDKSTDNSRDIIEQYRPHPKISNIVYNDQNSGSPFIQWKKGIELAKGDYIWIAESDDLAQSSFLENAVLILNNNPTVSLFYSRFNFLDNQNNIKPNNQVHFNGIYDGNDLIREYFCLYSIFYNANAIVFKKQKFETVNYVFLKQLRYTGDKYVWSEIISNSQVYFSEEILTLYRQHNENTSVKGKVNGAYYKENITMLNFFFKEYRIRTVKKIYYSYKWSKRIWRETDVITWLNLIFSNNIFIYFTLFPFIYFTYNAGDY